MVGVPVGVVAVGYVGGVVVVGGVVFAEDDVGCGVVVKPLEAVLGWGGELFVGGAVVDGADDADVFVGESFSPDVEQDGVCVGEELVFVGEEVFGPVDVDEVVVAEEGFSPCPGFDGDALGLEGVGELLNVGVEEHGVAPGG